MWRWRAEHVLAWVLALAVILCPRSLWDRVRLPVALAADRAGGGRGQATEDEADRARRELALVRAELARVKAQRGELQRMLAQATALQGVLATGGKPVRALPVKVSGIEDALASAGPRGGRVRIDAGSDQEVQLPAPLVQGSALAGRSIAVSRDASEVELVTSLTFRALCRNVRTGVEGMVRGAGGLEALFRADGADPDLREGDEIVTSAFSAIAPGALAVGTIVRVERDPETGLVEARLAPAAALLHIEEALVILSRPPAEPRASGKSAGRSAP